MRPFLTILSICLSAISFSQTSLDGIQYFYNVKNNNDSTFNYFMSFLNKCDSTDILKNLFCDKASERVGDYYKSKQEYLKAIAYYDSADTKYRDRHMFCGNAYYIHFIPRLYKIAQCYSELNNARQAITTLTPYIFDRLGSEYFDDTMTTFFMQTLYQVYTKQEIQKELGNAIAGIQYDISLSSDAAFLRVSCKLRLFDTELVLAAYGSSTNNGKIPYQSTKEYFIRQFKEFEIYKRLQK